MKTYIARDATTLFKKAAQSVLEICANTMRERDQVVMAISGGSTPKALFELLADPYHSARMPWSKLHLFWVDERCVPPTSPDSNYGMTKATLLSKVPIPEDNIHRMKGEMASPAEAARAYDNELKSFFARTKSPRWFDLILLGVGDDGHTASLFPGSEALHETERLATANSVEKLPTPRITLTFPVLNDARNILFVVSGAGKATIIREIFRDDRPNSYPAQKIQPAHGELVWMLDHDAASKLPSQFVYGAVHV